MDKVQNAIEALKTGKTILYPTDTVWGLGCDATNSDAVEKIKTLKNRPEDKSFIILVNSVAMLERYVIDFPEVCYDLIDLSDKPLTIIYDTPKGVAPNALNRDGSIAVRVTTDKLCRQIIQGLRKPIISTSANLSGEKLPKCFNEISDAIKKGVDLIIDERTEELMDRPSSIIKVKQDNTIQIIRK